MNETESRANPASFDQEPANHYAFHVRHRNGWGTGFGPRSSHCHQCGAPIPPMNGDCGAASYGCGPGEPIESHPDAPALKKGESLERSPAICYACCGENDRRDMIATGRATLYLTEENKAWRITNWPGSLSFPATRGHSSRNNFGARRTDVWFRGPDGATWHGVNIGDNQILRCKRTKQ